MDDNMFSYNCPLWKRDATSAASLQRCERNNTPAAWYWLSPVADDGRRQG